MLPPIGLYKDFIDKEGIAKDSNEPVAMNITASSILQKNKDDGHVRK